MSESSPEDPQAHSDASAAADHDPPPTPFDHPLFLPVLLAAFSVWFGYDAYLNDDPEMADHLAFNRFGLRIVGYLTVVVGYRGWCELKARRATPWIVPLMLGVMTLWFAYDGWLSQDSLNQQFQPFIRQAAACSAIASLAFAVTTWLRQRGTPEPIFLLPLLLMAFSLSFGSSARGQETLLVAYISACGGLGALALWLLWRQFHDRRART